MSGKALIVIDYQYCFLPGGSLATNVEGKFTGDNTGAKMAKKIDELIKDNQFDSVYFTKDMHHKIIRVLQNLMEKMYIVRQKIYIKNTLQMILQNIEDG